tara:strand:+ start:129 stop:440 length:312 start_codon:yes stop_codon:yes gene_type:complete
VEAVSTYDEYGEPDTLISEWFLSPNKSTCTLIGRYTDSRSFLYHMDRFLTGPHFKNINENIRPMKLSIYGNASDDVIQFFSDSDIFTPTFHTYIGGFARDTIN